MTDTNNTDHWKSLADEVGADVPAEAFERNIEPLDEDQANGDADIANQESPTETPMAIEPPKPKRKQDPPKTENQWESLAGELGVDFPSLAATDSVSGEDALDAEILNGEYDLFEPTSNDATIEGEVPFSVYDEEELDSVEDDLSDADSANDLDETELDGTSSEQDSVDSEETGRKRKRRRRRRRKPRQSEEDGAPALTSGAEEDATSDGSDDDDADIESTSDGSENQKSKHRKIPTWEEAISAVVQANIDSRSKSSGGGRRGRGRGKGKRS